MWIYARQSKFPITAWISGHVCIQVCFNVIGFYSVCMIVSTGLTTACNIHTQDKPTAQNKLLDSVLTSLQTKVKKTSADTTTRPKQIKQKEEKKTRYKILMQREGGGEVRRARKLKPISHCFLSLKRGEGKGEK